MDYTKKKLPDLRKLAKERELKGYEDLERKELIEMLESSNKGPEKDLGKDDNARGSSGPELSEEEEDNKKEEDVEDEEAEEEKEEEDIKETESSIIEAINIERYPEGSKAAAMKKNLDSQPKISILVPLEGDKPGATFPVTLNSLRINILKGIYVSVPRQVAEVIMESQKQTREAIEGPMRKLAHDGLPMKLDGDIAPLQR